MGIALYPSDSFRPHPNEEILEDYALHRLPEALVAQVEEHLLLCQTCQDAVVETDEFMSAMKMATSPPAVPSAGPRWQDRVNSLPNFAGKRSLVPILILVVIGFLWIRQPSPELSAPVAVSLTSLRGQSALAPAPAGKPLQLNIESPDLTTSGREYRIEVVDARGRPVWMEPATSTGGKLVATMSKPLPRGVYWARVYSADSELLREFGLWAQ